MQGESQLDASQEEPSFQQVLPICIPAKFQNHISKLYFINEKIAVYEERKNSLH